MRSTYLSWCSVPDNSARVSDTSSYELVRARSLTGNSLKLELCVKADDTQLRRGPSRGPSRPFLRLRSPTSVLRLQAERGDRRRPPCGRPHRTMSRRRPQVETETAGAAQEGSGSAGIVPVSKKQKHDCRHAGCKYGHRSKCCCTRDACITPPLVLMKMLDVLQAQIWDAWHCRLEAGWDTTCRLRRKASWSAGGIIVTKCLGEYHHAWSVRLTH